MKLHEILLFGLTGHRGGEEESSICSFLMLLFYIPARDAAAEELLNKL